MLETGETTEVKETAEVSDEAEDMDPELEAELDGKCEEYMSGRRSPEDIRRDREELSQMKEELLNKYQEFLEAKASEADDGDEDPEKVLVLRRYR